MKTKSILFIIFLLFTNFAFAQQEPELIIEENFDFNKLLKIITQKPINHYTKTL